MSEVTAHEFTAGVKLDGASHQLRCVADSGCWYTVFWDVAENTPERNCPPRQALNRTAQYLYNAAREFELDRVAVPGVEDTPTTTLLESGLRSNENTTRATRRPTKKPKSGRAAESRRLAPVGAPTPITPPNKRCVYVAKGEKLADSCLYYSPDPIDALSVVWKVRHVHAHAAGRAAARRISSPPSRPAPASDPPSAPRRCPSRAVRRTLASG